MAVQRGPDQGWERQTSEEHRTERGEPVAARFGGLEGSPAALITSQSGWSDYVARQLVAPSHINFPSCATYCVHPTHIPHTSFDDTSPRQQKFAYFSSNSFQLSHCVTLVGQQKRSVQRGIRKAGMPVVEGWDAFGLSCSGGDVGCSLIICYEII